MVDNHITFKKMTKNDLTTLHQWFHVPHVLQWYARGKRFSLNEIKQKYLPRINDDTIQSYFIHTNGKPVGYIQIYQVEHHLPEGIESHDHSIFSEYHLNELAGIDLFIADVNLLHTGFCSAMLNSFIENHIKATYHAIVVDPLKTNITAIKFFEKNGFTHITNQDELHHVMIRHLEDKI